MTDLDFQEPVVPVINVPLRSRSFYGGNIDQMPLLLADERTPMTPRQLLYERVHGANEHDRGLLRGNYIHTACGIISHESGEVIVGLYSDNTVKGLIHSLNPQSNIQNGSLIVEPDDYEAIKSKGFIISPDVAQKLRDSHYGEQSVREQFWRYIAEGDGQLFQDYLGLVQETTGGDMRDRMGLWISSCPGLRLLYVDRLGFRSDADGDDGLDDGDGRLVGVRLNVAEGDAPQKAQPYTAEDLENAQRQLESLKGLLNPGCISSLEALLSKLS